VVCSKGRAPVPALTRVSFSGRKILKSTLGKYLGDSLPHEAKGLRLHGFRKKPTLVRLGGFWGGWGFWGNHGGIAPTRSSLNCASRFFWDLEMLPPYLPLPITHYRLPITNYPLPITHYPYGAFCHSGDNLRKLN